MTPLSTLSLTRIALTALINHGIESVEGLGRLTPAKVHRLMPYCHAMMTLAQFGQWHNRRYPCPLPLPKREDDRDG